MAATKDGGAHKSAPGLVYTVGVAAVLLLDFSQPVFILFSLSLYFGYIYKHFLGFSLLIIINRFLSLSAGVCSETVPQEEYS